MAAPDLDVLACLTPAWQTTPALWLRVSVLAAVMTVGGWVSAQRFFPGRAAFLAVHAAMGVWLLATALEHFTTQVDCKATMALSAWPAILAIPLLWALFLRQYVYSEHRPPRLAQWFGFGLPLVAMAALALSNGEHGLLYPSVTETTLPGGQHVVRFGRGPLFLVAVAWGYSLLLASSLMVLRTWRSAQGEERGHWLGFLMISAVPWASNLGYVVFDLRLFGSDPTPISFALAAGGFAWLIRAKRLFDVVPMARHLLFAELPDPVLILDSSGRVMEANNAARQLAGLSSSLGRPLAQWPGLGAQIAERLATPDTGNLLSPAGSPSIYELRVAPIGRDGRQIGRLLQLHDVTEQQHAQARMVQTLAERNSQLSQVAALQDELREQALRDPLTGLHNRRALEQRFAQEAEYHGTTGQPLALVLIDIDHFKRINDTRGHAAGDAVLCDFAALLRGGLRSGDSVFRVGGEEFALLLPGAEAEQASTRVAVLRESLRRVPPAAARGAMTFSAGIAAFGQAGTTLDTMLHAADTALYQAKAAGRDRTVLATP
jgi:diguanylate cyclase (GGDEF)-like protein